MSAAREFELVVIGGGPAGQKAAIQGAKAGRRVLLVDRQRNPGGECVQRGTIPSKTLRETALWLSGLRRHAPRLFDLRLSRDQEVSNLMQRLDAVRDAHEAFMKAQLERNDVESWRGAARFVDAHEVAVVAPDGSERRARGAAIVVATGSRPRVPDNVPVDHEHVLDSDSVLSLIYLPASLTVLGGGVIASEFASIFAALGVQVTMVDKADRPLAFMEPELCERFLEAFRSMGGTYLGGRVVESARFDGVSSVETRLAGGEVLRAEKVLCALGRVAAVQGLDLEKAGIELTSRGVIPVDEACRTVVPHVFAAGDAIGPPALAASSMEQGRRAARAALGLDLGSDGELLPTGIYTIPEMAAVGLTEAQAVERLGGAVVGRAHFAELARGQISGDTEGMLKLVADPEGRRLVGAHIIGRGATDLIHVAQMAMVGGLDVDAFIENTFNFPTLAEAYRVGALALAQARPSLRKAI